MNEKIKNLLGEELANQVKEKLGEVQIGVTNDGTLVPAEKHDQLKVDFKELNEKLEKADSDLKEFSDTSTTIEELKTKLEESNNNYQAFKTEVDKRDTNRSKQSSLEKLLKDNGALPSVVDLLVKSFDLESIQVDSKGNVVDGDLIINPIKEERKELFATKTIEGQKPPKGTTDNTEDLDDQAYFNLMMEKNK